MKIVSISFFHVTKIGSIVYAGISSDSVLSVVPFGRCMFCLLVLIPLYEVFCYLQCLIWISLNCCFRPAFP